MRKIYRKTGHKNYLSIFFVLRIVGDYRGNQKNKQFKLKKTQGKMCEMKIFFDVGKVQTRGI